MKAKSIRAAREVLAAAEAEAEAEAVNVANIKFSWLEGENTTVRPKK